MSQSNKGAKKKTLSLKGGTLKVTKKKKDPVGNIKINKCWNTIRFIAEHDYFSAHLLPIIEETLLPLFEYMVNPQEIDFDDDIIFCICSILKKGKKASPVLRKVFPFLKQFQIKYKGIFGNLLQALNMYIVYAKDMFQEESEGARVNLGHIFEMASMSMYRSEKPVMLGNNMEGALLLQIALQNLEGPII